MVHWLKAEDGGKPTYRYASIGFKKFILGGYRNGSYWSAKVLVR